MSVIDHFSNSSTTVTFINLEHELRMEPKTTRLLFWGGRGGGGEGEGELGAVSCTDVHDSFESFRST